MNTPDPARDGPPTPNDLTNPAFLAYLGRLGELPVRPEPEDFARPKRGAAGGGGDAAEEYRQAQERKAMRLYERWKAGQK